MARTHVSRTKVATARTPVTRGVSVPVVPPPTTPVISGVTVTDITNTSAIVTWNVDQYATGIVDYGTTAGYGTSTTEELSFNYNRHVQHITGLTQGTLYHYRIRSSNATAQEGSTSDATFTTVATGTETLGRYGMGVAFDSLNNTRVGDTVNRKVAWRFRAEQSSALTTIRAFIAGLINGQPDSGYSLGNGGTIRVTLQADDGSGFPSTTILASCPDRTGLALSVSVDFPFSVPYTLTAGTVYHIVWTNVSASYATNWVSTDGGYYFGNQHAPLQKRWPDSDFAELIKEGAGAWSINRGGVGNGIVTPVYDMTYSNGQHQGNGYMERFGGSPYWLICNGTQRLRQRITPTATKVVRGVWVRMARNSGTAALVVELQNSAGTAIDTVNVTYSTVPAFPRGASESSIGDWFWVPFAADRTMTGGALHFLEFRTTAGSEYWTWGVRKANGSGVFYNSATWFADGYGQWYNGSVWANMRDQSGDAVTYGDLQFDFQTVV